VCYFRKGHYPFHLLFITNFCNALQQVILVAGRLHDQVKWFPWLNKGTQPCFKLVIFSGCHNIHASRQVVFFKFLFCPCINNQDVVFHIVCPYQKGNPGHAPAKVLGSPFVDRHVVSEISGDKRLFLQDLFYKFGF